MTARFTTQIEICRLIRSLPSDDHQVIATFGAVLTQQLGYHSLQQFFVQAFLQNRLQLSDESNNKVLSYLHDVTAIDSLPRSKSTQSAIESLPRDIFNYIGSYLRNIDCVSGFSHCNHNIHKMVLTRGFVGEINIRERLVMTPNVIKNLIDNNSCSLLLHFNRYHVDIVSNDQEKISCCANNPCVLCQFHSNIKKSMSCIINQNNY